MTILVPLIGVVALLVVWAACCPPIEPEHPTFDELVASLTDELTVFATQLGRDFVPAVRAAAAAVEDMAKAWRGISSGH